MKRLSLHVIPILALLALPLACSGGVGASGASYSGPPVVVIGVDGLEMSVLKPLLDEGRLPNIQSLLDRGIGGYLGTMIPTFSPVVWTTIATGKSWQEHGIPFFSQMSKAGTILPNGLPYTSNCRAVPAVWNMADMNGVDALAVAWWVSWPAEALRYGRIVASYAAQAQGAILWKAGVWEEGLPEMTWPPELMEEIEPALRDGAPGGELTAEYLATFQEIPEEWPLAKEKETLFRLAYAGDSTHVRIFNEQLEKEVAGLNMVYVGLPDVAGHFFWRFHEPEVYNFEVDERQLAVQKDHINLSYEVTDRWIGEILKRCPDDARILVLSDHGMHAAPQALDNPLAKQSGNHEDAPPGILIMAGPGIRQGGLMVRKDGLPIAGVLDVTPTILHLLGLEVPPDTQGGPLMHLMKENWRKQHPVRKRATSYDEGWREPTDPREPKEGASQDFNRRIMDELGYSESMDSLNDGK